MRPALTAAGSSGDLLRASEAVDQFVLFGTVLTLVSNLLFVAALYTAWRRIYRKEIPPPPGSASPRLAPASFAPSFAPSPAPVATPRAAPSQSTFKECRACGTVLDRTVTACAVCGAPA